MIERLQRPLNSWWKNFRPSSKISFVHTVQSLYYEKCNIRLNLGDFTTGKKNQQFSEIVMKLKI